MGAIEQTLAALGGLVIPGRCRKAAASPESILPDLWLWIPGSRPAAEPRNDETRFRPNTPRRSEAKPSLARLHSLAGEHDRDRTRVLDHLPGRRQLAGAAVNAERDHGVALFICRIEEMSGRIEANEAWSAALGWLPADHA